jgi:hypothetical protein
MNPLTNKQQDICSYAGLAGALINATCLVQHFVIMTYEAWLSYVMLGVYVFAILSFSLLAIQKAIGPWLLIGVAALMFITEILFVISGVFSLIILISMLYSVIVVIAIFVEQLPQKLRQKALAEKAEALAWKDKI